MYDIAKLRTEFSTVHAAIGAVIDAAAAAGRELTAEETQANAGRYAQLDGIKAKIDAATKFATYKLDDAPGATGTVTLPRDPAGKAETVEDPHRLEFSGDIQVVSDPAKVDRVLFGKAARHWAHTGQMDQRFATITTATASSILLPKTVVAPLVTGAQNTFREGYGAWGIKPMETMGDTSTFNLPVLDPTAGGQVAENASAETENAPGMSESIVSTVKTYQSGSVYYSNLQLGATSFDLLGQTVPHMQYNKELGLESVIVAAMIADAGITQVVTTATATGFTYANSVSLANKLPKRYQKFKIRLLGTDAYAAAEGLVDTTGRPVMVADPQGQNLKSMHGTPTIRCDYLEAMTTAKIIGLEISLIGFHLRDAGEGITRYDQVPAKPNQTGINLFGYHAYGYAVSAVAKFKTA